MTTRAMVVLSTAPSPEVARELASQIVRRRLAACVNLVEGLRSLYWWEGEVHEDPEVLMIVKTSAERLPALTATLEEHHPYECPEVVALDVTGGSEAYLGWLHESVSMEG